MKKPLLCAAAGLLLLCSTGALAEQTNYTMTREEMQAVWQESCTRLNTQFNMEITTLDELSPYFRHKSDLIITSLPMEGDLPYDEALQLAKSALQNKYGVSEAELDAMGVYPRLMDYVYMEDESEWEFFFTSATDINVLRYHELPAGGEYLAVIGARTGNVINTVWHRGGLTEQILIEKAWEAALLRSEMDPQIFEDTFAPAYIHHYDRELGICLALIYHRTADQPGGDSHVFQVILDYDTGRVIELEFTDGVG